MIKWKYLKEKMLIKIKRDGIGHFLFVFEDTIHNCILHHYIAPLRVWERWEIEVVYGIFRIQVKEMLE